jgi:hypothetical protein
MILQTHVKNHTELLKKLKTLLARRRDAAPLRLPFPFPPDSAYLVLADRDSRTRKVAPQDHPVNEEFQGLPAFQEKRPCQVRSDQFADRQYDSTAE